jgi:hypothetical protein
MGKQLARRLDAAPETFVIDPRSNEQDVRMTLEGVRRSDVTLVSLFIRFQSGRGRIALPALGRSTLERIEASGARVIAVSFGTPYLLRELSGLKTYVAAYGGQPVVQGAAARALFGEAGFSGRLPVTIPGAAARGDGIQKPAAR